MFYKPETYIVPEGLREFAKDDRNNLSKMIAFSRRNKDSHSLGKQITEYIFYLRSFYF